MHIDICSVTRVATADVYLQFLNMKANEVFKTTPGEISGSHGGEYENILLDVAPCSLVEV
jgi:hypothetical protein